MGMPRTAEPLSWCLSLPANMFLCIYRDREDTEQVKYLYPYQWVLTGVKDLHGLRITRNRYETLAAAQLGSIKDLILLGYTLEEPE